MEMGTIGYIVIAVLIAAVVVVLSKVSASKRLCPHCHTMMPKKVTKCPKCGKQIPLNY